MKQSVYLSGLFFYYLLLTTCAFFITSCGTLAAPSATTTTSAGGTSYFPNTTGYTWTYQVSDGTSNIITAESNVLLPGPITAQQWTITQVGTSSPGVLRNYNQLTSSQLVYWGASAEGSAVITTEGLGDLQFPMRVGENWVRFSQGSSLITASIEALETVIVPLATYANCFKITYKTYAGSILISSGSNWYADNVGLVKQISTTTTTKELIYINF